MEPRDPKALGEKILEIDRVTQELNLAGDFPFDFLSILKLTNIHN